MDANTQDTVVSPGDMMMESYTRPTTGEAPDAAMEAREQGDVPMSEAGEAIAVSNANTHTDVRWGLNPGPNPGTCLGSNPRTGLALGAGLEHYFSPGLSFTASSGSGSAANFSFGPITYPSPNLIVDSGSNLIANPGFSTIPGASLGASPMATPLAQPLFEPSHQPLLRSTQDPPVSLETFVATPFTNMTRSMPSYLPCRPLPSERRRRQVGMGLLPSKLQPCKIQPQLLSSLRRPRRI